MTPQFGHLWTTKSLKSPPARARPRYVCLRFVENAIAGATLFAGTMLRAQRVPVSMSAQKTRNLPPQTDYDVDDDDDDDDAVMYICIRVLLVTISSY